MQIFLLAAGLISWLVVVPAFIRWNHARGERTRGGHFQGEDEVGDGGVSAHQVDLDGAMSRLKDERVGGQRGQEPSGGDVSGNVGDRGAGRDGATAKKRNKRNQDKERIVSGDRLSTTTPLSRHFFKSQIAKLRCCADPQPGPYDAEFLLGRRVTARECGKETLDAVDKRLQDIAKWVGG
jgi:hypothetical protein